MGIISSTFNLVNIVDEIPYKWLSACLHDTIVLTVKGLNFVFYRILHWNLIMTMRKKITGEMIM